MTVATAAVATAEPVVDVDVLVAGAGPAGLIATAGFAAQGQRVLCVDPAPVVTREDARGADLRSTAFLQPSVALLERIGVWSHLSADAAPLQIMRIIDAGGAAPEARLVRDFDAADLSSDAPFGWNVANWALRRGLMAHIAASDLASFRAGTAVEDLCARASEALVRFSDGTRVRARLVVGADGRNSRIRQALGIDTTTLRYGQKALAFAVTHPRPHENVSTEIHRSGGPFTLVPLPDRDGKPQSAVVWMERGPRAEELASLDDGAFHEALQLRSTGVLGELTRVTPINQYPIISQIADRFTGPRTALIAEAAHVVPPIGAQGLNMSLADLSCLLDEMRAEPGNPEGLARFERARWLETRARLQGIDLLNRASMISARPLRDLRAAGLGAIYGIGPVRRLMMRAGLGAN